MPIQLQLSQAESIQRYWLPQNKKMHSQARKQERCIVVTSKTRFILQMYPLLECNLSRALILYQLLKRYKEKCWSNDFPGWIHISTKDFRALVGTISMANFGSAVKWLVDRGLIETEVMLYDFKRETHYKLNVEELGKFIDSRTRDK